MKFTSSILAIYIFLLAVVSAQGSIAAKADKESHKKSCCSSMQNKHERDFPAEKHKGCCKGICNPFMACCGFTLMNKYFSIGAFSGTDKRFPVLNDKILSDFSSDTWHPPKIA